MRTVFNIIKNFFPVLFGELRDLLGRNRKARWIFAVLIIASLSFGGYKIWKNFYPDPNSQNLTLSQAGRIGEVTTHKLMVQIENKNCPPETQSGCYERGDIVLIKDGAWEFSGAEKNGFLILHMDLTEKQAEILVQALEKKMKTPSVPDGTSPPLKEGEEKLKDIPPQMETLKMRKYAVSLSEIGISPDDQKGRENNDTIYKWEIVKEKRRP